MDRNLASVPLNISSTSAKNTETGAVKLLAVAAMGAASLEGRGAMEAGLEREGDELMSEGRRKLTCNRTNACDSAWTGVETWKSFWSSTSLWPVVSSFLFFFPSIFLVWPVKVDG